MILIIVSSVSCVRFILRDSPLFVLDRVGDPCLPECPEPEFTAVTISTGFRGIPVAGPGKVERYSEFQSIQYDIFLFHVYNGSDDPNVRLRSCPDVYEPFKSVVKFPSAIRISGTVLGNSSDKKSGCADYFSPGNRTAKKMGISEWNIRGWNTGSVRICIGYGDGTICQARSSGLTERCNAAYQAFCNSIMVGNLSERSHFTFFGTLSVLCVKGRYLVIPAGECKGYKAVHTTAHKCYSFWRRFHVH